MVDKPDKIIFPDTGLSKADLAEYYERIAPYMLPLVEGRPLTLYRCPDGIDAGGFFQKAVPDYFPHWIRRVTVARKEGGSITHPLAADADSLRFFVDQGTTAFHVWLSRADKPARPDRLIFDLDPPGDDFAQVIDAARAVRAALADRDLESYVMTTGSSGLHVTVPLDRRADFATVRSFAQKVAAKLVDAQPRTFTDEHRLNKRRGRLYLDIKRNAYAQTAIAPYSVRAKPNAPVATPLVWDELGPKMHPQRYRVDNIMKRLAQRECPWRGIERNPQTIPAAPGNSARGRP